MWKYRSKSHLLALLISFLVGCGLGYLSLQSGTDIYEDVYPAEVIQFIQQNHLIVCLASGLSIAGIINPMMADSKVDMNCYPMEL